MPVFESLFDNTHAALKATTHLRALPKFADNGWRPRQPHTWRDPSQCCFISHDTENKELDFDNGAGWSRDEVIQVGHSFALYWSDGTTDKLYLPMRHEIDTHLNLDPTKVTLYAQACLHTPMIPKGYANGIYDIGTSTTDGVFVQGEIHEIQYAESLLSEDENVALDVLANKYLGVGKETNELYEWCAAAYGGNPTGSQRANIYRASPLLVGPYAEQDAALIKPILDKQWPRMQAENLLGLYRMECDEIRLLVRMRLQGCRIDLPYLDELSQTVNKALTEKIAQFYHLTGIITSDSCPTGDIAKAFDKIGIRYRITEKTKQPSITADDLKIIPHPVAKLALEIRQYGKIKSTFIEGTLMSKHKHGIVHGSFEPMRGEAGTGARTGRFVSNNPNLQTIPVRTEIGKKIRKAFIPFQSHMCWQKSDFSQYEYRILSHYAVGTGADELRAKYRNDPKTDYHTSTTEMVKRNAASAYAAWEIAGVDAGKIRKRIKTVNFGMMNLMGLELLCAELGIPVSEGKVLLTAYHESNPYVKETVKYFEEMAHRQGYVQTILGRRRRFNLWEPKPRWNEETRKFDKWPALRYQHACSHYGPNIQRAMCHTGLNSVTQGSNADGIKASMVQADKEGIFDITGVPTLTVHDELDFSVIDDSPIQQQAYARLVEIMEHALPLSIPIRVDSGRGPNWGDIE